MGLASLPPARTFLSNDGVRFEKSGRTTKGNYPYVCLSNPELVANVLFEKSHRAAVSEHNFRKWS